ncbi:MAG: RNA 2',3'-cyclic phosphodiesterase [Bacteroidales bacterium]|nr:RNA 2',3'-cyclic phosphodiesterase [Bacteroidales bacterium]
MNSIRTFAAIEVKPEKQMVLLWDRLKAILPRESATWVNPGTTHITLLFLGETPINQIGRIGNILREMLTSFPAFNLTIKGIGTFGTPNPKVIWLGADYSKELMELKRLVDEALNPMGYSDRDKPYTPHLTLGRIKRLNNPNLLINELEANRNTIVQTAAIGKLTLYESTLTPRGAIYTPIEIVTLHPTPPHHGY